MEQYLETVLDMLLGAQVGNQCAERAECFFRPMAGAGFTMGVRPKRVEDL